MREDMFKVIVEHPRHASRFADSPKLKRQTHPDCKQIGLKRHARESAHYWKSLSENLAPLERYLHKQRGRPWNKVFSEICEHLDTGSTVKMHIREHIEDFIVVKVHIEANGKWFGQTSDWRSYAPLESWWQKLYVDPNDGIIKETEKLRRKLRVERKRYSGVSYGYELGPFTDFVRLGADRVLIRRKGLWFEQRLDRDPKCRGAQLRHELIEATWQTHERWAVVETRQLSSKALKAHGLQNECE